MGKITSAQQHIADTLGKRTGLEWRAYAHESGTGFVYRTAVTAYDYSAILKKLDGFFVPYFEASEPTGHGIRILSMTDSNASRCLQEYARQIVLFEVRRRGAAKSPQGHDGRY